MKIMHFCLVAGMSLLVVVVGCGKNDADKPQTSPRAVGTGGEPKDYFPTAIGLRWVYEIVIGDTEPLRYDQTSWPVGDRRAVYASRGRFLPVIQDQSRKSYRLVIQVKGAASKQGPLEYPEGVELEVVEDELGVFDNAKQVFWAASTSGRYMAHLVVTYDPMTTPGAPSGGAWGAWGQGDGYSMRLIFFGERPGIEIGMGEEPSDTLLFEGSDAHVAGRKGEQLLHFVRTVERADGEAGQGALGSRFAEHTWFAKGKGLVRLEQRVKGQTSMTWTLASLSMGAQLGAEGPTQCSPAKVHDPSRASSSRWAVMATAYSTSKPGADVDWALMPGGDVTSSCCMAG